MRFDPPMLTEGPLTGKVYVTTHGKLLPHPARAGEQIVESSVKYDVTDQFEELSARRAPGVSLRRTPVHVDSLAVLTDETWVYCTPAGPALPLHSVVLPLSDFPESLIATVGTGKVFFARVNLAARRSWECVVEKIEPEWGNTDGFLHFEDGEA